MTDTIPTVVLDNHVVGHTGGNAAPVQNSDNAVSGFCAIDGHAAIWGHHYAAKGTGIAGTCYTEGGTGVLGDVHAGDGVLGFSTGDASYSAVKGVNKGSGYGIYGETKGVLAGYFKGGVEVTRDLWVHGDVKLVGADCAEDFDLAGHADVPPGSVMVIADEGTLAVSAIEYDKRVAGVVSGAGDYRPGVVLDRTPSAGPRATLALLGKVFCR